MDQRDLRNEDSLQSSSICMSLRPRPHCLFLFLDESSTPVTRFVVVFRRHNIIIGIATKPDSYLRMGCRYYHNNCFCGARPVDHRRGPRNRPLGHGGHSPLYQWKDGYPRGTSVFFLG